MKRSEMIDILIHTMSKESFRQQFEDGIPSLEKMANILLNTIEEEGMLPPERLDDCPLGYGAGWVSDEEVIQNYFEFKYSWEPENE